MSEDEEPIKLGFFTKNHNDFILETEKSIVMGMYGGATDQHVTELGFIVQDLDCMIQYLNDLAAKGDQNAIN